MENKTPRQRLAGFMPICIAAILIDAVYIGLIYYLEQNGGISAKISNPNIQTYIFTAAIVLAVIMILAVPFTFKRFVGNYKPKPSDTGDYFTKYAGCWIAFMAAANSISVLGFIVYLTGDDVKKTYICVALNALVLALNLPKRAHLEKLQKIEQDAKSQQELLKNV
jgi:hypothetical protein